MKGFAATPIIFIAVFLVTAMLFVHFMDMDKQTAEGVGKEARLLKLQADVLKNQSAGAAELYSCMLYGLRFSADEDELKTNIGTCVNKDVTVANSTDGLTAYYTIPYNAELIDASISRNVTVSERVSYK